MRFFFKRKDGGQRSNVTGYWLIEWKRGFSIALLHFSDGARDCYHSHAFNCWSWMFKGKLVEDRIKLGLGSQADRHVWSIFKPSIKPIFTERDNLHRVTSVGSTWVLTFRGPWHNTWYEYRFDMKRYRWDIIKLTHGRKEVA